MLLILQSLIFKRRLRIHLEEAAQRLRAVEMEQQREQNTKEINEQRLRDESISRNMQQRLIDLEQQSRAAAEDLVNLSELKQRELTLKDECAHTRIVCEPSSKKIRDVFAFKRSR